jgi:HEPN domain-containing protein/predicted nucleotidyltransferase
MVTLKDAKEVSERINKTFHPLSITVFGSIAREGSGNDLDLLIVIDDKNMPSDNVDLLMQRCLKDFYKKFAIDPFVVPLSTFRKHYYKGSPFLKMILKEGRLLYMKDAINEWIKHAEDEFKSAVYLFEGEYFRTACFHSQQAVEMALKALLISKGWDLEKTHNIRKLLSNAADYNIAIDIDDDDISFIDTIYRGRYPAEAGLLPLGEPTKADAQRAVSIAEQIIKKAKTKLNKK